MYETPKTHFTTRLFIPNLKTLTHRYSLSFLSLSQLAHSGTINNTALNTGPKSPLLQWGRKADRVQFQDSRPKEGGKLADTKKGEKKGKKPDNGGSQ